MPDWRRRCRWSARYAEVRSSRPRSDHGVSVPLASSSWATGRRCDRRTIRRPSRPGRRPGDPGQEPADAGRGMTRDDDSTGRGGGRGVVHGMVESQCPWTAVVAELAAAGGRVPDIAGPAEQEDEDPPARYVETPAAQGSCPPPGRWPRRGGGRLRITGRSSPGRIAEGPMRPGAARSLRGSAVIGGDPGRSARPALRMDAHESAGTTGPHGGGADAKTLDGVGRIASQEKRSTP